MHQSLDELTLRLAAADRFSYAQVGNQRYVVIYPTGKDCPEIVPLANSEKSFLD